VAGVGVVLLLVRAVLLRACARASQPEPRRGGYDSLVMR
jgi:hypothetical protein